MERENTDLTFAPQRGLEQFQCVNEAMSLSSASSSGEDSESEADMSVRAEDEDIFGFGSSDELITKRSIALERVSQDGLTLQYTCAELRDDDKVAKIAVAQNGLALEYVSERLRADRDVVWPAVVQRLYGDSLQYASPTLKDDLPFILELLGFFKFRFEPRPYNLLAPSRSDGHRCLIANHISQRLQVNEQVLQLVSEITQSDNREIMLSSVREHGLDMQFVSVRLRADRELVLAAVTQDGEALVYANDALKEDPGIVLAAVGSSKHGWALRHASQALRANVDFVQQAVGIKGAALRYAAETVRSDRATVLVAVKQHGFAINYAAANFYQDREVVFSAVSTYGSALRLVSLELRADREVVSRAVANAWTALAYATEELRNDRELALVAIRQNGYALGYASPVLRNDPEVALEAMRAPDSEHAFTNVSGELQQDRKFLIATFIVRQNWKWLRFSVPNTINPDFKCLQELLQDYEMLTEAEQAELVPQLWWLIPSKDDSIPYFTLSTSQAINTADYFFKVIQIIPEKFHTCFFKGIPKNLSEDRQFILALVRNQGDLLQCASDALRADEAVVFEAFCQNSAALAYAHSALRINLKTLMGEGLPANTKALISKFCREESFAIAKRRMNSFSGEGVPSPQEKMLSLIGKWLGTPEEIPEDKLSVVLSVVEKVVKLQRTLFKSTAAENFHQFINEEGLAKIRRPEITDEQIDKIIDKKDYQLTEEFDCFVDMLLSASDFFPDPSSSAEPAIITNELSQAHLDFIEAVLKAKNPQEKFKETLDDLKKQVNQQSNNIVLRAIHQKKNEQLVCLLLKHGVIPIDFFLGNNKHALLYETLVHQRHAIFQAIVEAPPVAASEEEGRLSSTKPRLGEEDVKTFLATPMKIAAGVGGKSSLGAHSTQESTPIGTILAEDTQGMANVDGNKLTLLGRYLGVNVKLHDNSTAVPGLDDVDIRNITGSADGGHYEAVINGKRLPTCGEGFLCGYYALGMTILGLSNQELKRTILTQVFDDDRTVNCFLGITGEEPIASRQTEIGLTLFRYALRPDFQAWFHQQLSQFEQDIAQEAERVNEADLVAEREHPSTDVSTFLSEAAVEQPGHTYETMGSETSNNITSSSDCSLFKVLAAGRKVRLGTAERLIDFMLNSSL